MDRNHQKPEWKPTPELKGQTGKGEAGQHPDTMPGTPPDQRPEKGSRDTSGGWGWSHTK